MKRNGTHDTMLLLPMVLVLSSVFHADPVSAGAPTPKPAATRPVVCTGANWTERETQVSWSDSGLFIKRRNKVELDGMPREGQAVVGTGDDARTVVRFKHGEIRFKDTYGCLSNVESTWALPSLSKLFRKIGGLQCRYTTGPQNCPKPGA